MFLNGKKLNYEDLKSLVYFHDITKKHVNHHNNDKKKHPCSSSNDSHIF